LIKQTLELANKNISADGKVVESYKRKNIKNDPGVVIVHIKHGYRCAYSIEEQPAGLFKHLSISVDSKGKLPMPEAVQLIAVHFGVMPIASAWIEQFEPDHFAVNVISLIGTPQIGHA
jgi:hypothetical protein